MNKIIAGKIAEKELQSYMIKEPEVISRLLTESDHTTAENNREAFKQESRRLDQEGGPKSDSNYNKYESPGKLYREQDGEARR